MGTLKSVLENFIGVYTPVVKTLSDGSEVVQYDIAYICSCIMLVLVVYCILRVIGGLICNK